MKPTDEQLCGAILAIGAETSQPQNDAAVAELIELRLVKRKRDGTLSLTQRGWTTYTGIESGDLDP